MSQPSGRTLPVVVVGLIAYSAIRNCISFAEVFPRPAPKAQYSSADTASFQFRRKAGPIFKRHRFLNLARDSQRDAHLHFSDEHVSAVRKAVAEGQKFEPPEDMVESLAGAFTPLKARWNWGGDCPERMQQQKDAVADCVDNDRASVDVGKVAGRVYQTQKSGFGLVQDSLNIGISSTATGIGMMKGGIDFGMGIASTVVSGLADGFDMVPGGFGMVVSLPLRFTDGVLGGAHTIARGCTSFGGATAHYSMTAVKHGFGLTGAREGEIFRVVFGREAGDAICSVFELLNTETEALNHVPIQHLVARLEEWSNMQGAAIAAKHVKPTPVAIPRSAERWLQFAAAIYDDNPYQGLASQGLENARIEIVHHQPSEGPFFPVWLVAIDHDTGQIIVSIRGTTTARDALTDLVCDPVPIQIFGVEGVAHQGMLRSARKIEDRVAEEVTVAMSKLNGPYKVIVTGHSLGAGVAALVVGLWKSNGRFPGVALAAWSFACPALLDQDTAKRLASSVTSVVADNDLVPRLSKMSAEELRDAVLLLDSPWKFGVMEDFRSRGLSSAHNFVREKVRKETKETPRLIPAGRLLRLESGKKPAYADSTAVDEILLSTDMISAHHTGHYLKLVKASF